MSPKIIFRADGGPTVGMGHFTRTLALAHILKHDFECTFATINPTKYQEVEVLKHCTELISLPGGNENFTKFLECLNGDEIVLMDNYYFSSDYQTRIRNKGCKVVYIDDFNDKHYVCDALINNIPGFEKSSFSKEQYTKLYLGTDYALLREDFLNPKWRLTTKIKNKIFLSFGGSDAYNLTLKIIRFLESINPDFIINILIGDAYQYIETLNEFPLLNIHRNITASSVANLMAEAELCIVPASSLLNEISSIGSKVLLGYFVENQIQPYNYFVENKMAVGVGNLLTVDFLYFKQQFELLRETDYLIRNQHTKYHLQQIVNLRKIFLSL